MQRRCGDGAVGNSGQLARACALSPALLNEERDGARGTARVLDHDQRVAALERAGERLERVHAAAEADGEHGHLLASPTLGRDVLDELLAERILAAPARQLGVVDEQEVSVVRVERGGLPRVLLVFPVAHLPHLERLARHLLHPLLRRVESLGSATQLVVRLLLRA